MDLEVPVVVTTAQRHPRVAGATEDGAAITALGLSKKLRSEMLQRLSEKALKGFEAPQKLLLKPLKASKQPETC